MSHRRTTFSYFYVHLVNDIAFVPQNHCDNCKSKDYELVMQYQKFLDEGDTKKANSMALSVNFLYGESSLANIKNVLDVTPDSIEKNATENENN
uniref:Uncharacterized protein n=1 Tax=Panagrolaimus sp. ES5 TaxID=591445 RepID=A0AC34G2K1_9BILA